MYLLKGLHVEGIVEAGGLRFEVGQNLLVQVDARGTNGCHRLLNLLREPSSGGVGELRSPTVNLKRKVSNSRSSNKPCHSC